MTSSADIWMPCYIADEAIETAHWSRDECGAGHLLKKSYWKNGGPLPADNARLARIAKATPEEWSALRPVMLEIFEELDGQWVHSRLDEEIAKARSNAVAKSAAGKKGAESRWGGDGKRNSNRDGERNGRRIAAASGCHWQTDSPSPSPSPSPLTSPNLFEEFFEACPKKVGRSEAEEQYNLALAKVDATTLLEAMRQYAKSRNGQDPTFTKTPAKWLLAERWKDYAATVVETIKPEALAKLRAQWGGVAGKIIDDIGIANFKTWLERCALLGGPPKKLIADSAYKAGEIDKRFGTQLRKRLSEDLTIEAAA